ncbi:MAG: hypothetical protein IJW38_03440 [Clostridia bacterium]|nr:hypothetical protein [Clostridia bacterium]
MIFNCEPSKSARLDFFEYVNEKCPNVTSGILTKSILSSDIHYYKIGNGKRNIISVAAHHGMEHISSATLYKTILDLSHNLTRSATSYGVNIAFLLQKFTFWFIPCLNVDGVDMSLHGAPESPIRERQIKMNGGEDFSCWQANARGVDLNHNYDFRFLEYKRLEANEEIMPGKTRYSGEYPESEPESRGMASLVRTLAPEIVLSFHTQGEEIYFRPRSSEKSCRIAEKSAELLGYTLSLPSGLADFGGLSDYSGEILGITSLTVELGRGKNPLPYSMLGAIAERVYKLHVVLPIHL